MDKNKIVLEDANDIFLENVANIKRGDFTRSVDELIKRDKYVSALENVYIVSIGAKKYEDIVDKVVGSIDSSGCLFNIDKSNIEFVSRSIEEAGFTSEQANLYIEKKYGIDRGEYYSAIGFLRDSSFDKADDYKKGGR